jgi:uncharacterized protein DUF3465
MVPHNSERVVAVTRGTSLAVVAALAVCGCALNGGNADNAGALDAIAQGRTGAEVIVEGDVLQVLSTSDSETGDHERFVVAVKSGADEQDVLVADNISIARAAPVHAGDDVTVKGELAIDPTGPVIHWTHHDPSGRHEAGFIRDHGVIYD